MHRSLLALGSVLLLFAGTARSEQFLLTVDQAIIGQSNVFKTSEVEVGDASYELTPRFRFLRPKEKFFYDVEYAPSLEAYFATDGISGFDHFLKSRFEYYPSRIDTLRLRADIADYRAIRGSTLDGPTGIPEVVPGTLGDVTRVLVDAEYERQVTRTTLTKGRLGLQHYGYTTGTNADSTGLRADASVVYELLPILALGGGIGGSYRAYDAIGFQPSSDNAVINASAIIQSQPTPTSTFEFEIGPAGIFVRQDAPGGTETERFSTEQRRGETFGGVFIDNPASPTTCTRFDGQPTLNGCPLVLAPQLAGRRNEQTFVDYDVNQRPDAESSNVVTYFLRATLRKDDAWGYVKLDIFRTEDASAGTGFTNIRSSVTGTAAYTLNEAWSFRMRANWNQRDVEGELYQPFVRAARSDVAVGEAFFFAEADGLIPNSSRAQIKTTQYWFDLLATRILSDRLSLDLGFRCQFQEQVLSDGSTLRDFRNFVGSALIRYSFDSIEY